MKSRDEKIKAVLAEAYNTILAGVQNEDGFDNAEGRLVMKKILGLFKPPLPLDDLLSDGSLDADGLSLK